MKETHTIPIIILGVCLLISFFTYTDDNFAKVWSVGSNVAYLAPAYIALLYADIRPGKTISKIDFYYIFLCVFFVVMSIISATYHLCMAYDDQCIFLSKNNWGHTDTFFSWVLLLTLISYVVLKYRASTMALFINFVVIVLTREFHCDDKNYDCQSIRIAYILLWVVTGVTFNIMLHKNFRVGKAFQYNWFNLILAVIAFAVASLFYFAHYLPSHTMWHTFGAFGSSVSLTVYDDSPVHLFNLNLFVGDAKVKVKDDEERQSLLNREDLKYYG